MEKFDGRGKSKNPNKLRNLPQYKNLTDDELEKLMESREQANTSAGELEGRIKEKLAKFEEDYDLTDMKINDWEVLRGMIQAIIKLEDFEQLSYNITNSGINPDNIILIDKLAKICSDLRTDISKAQTDLNITRKHRRSDQEASVLAYIESLKEKARKFYQSRMSYVFCPKCNTLLSTVWTLYPDSPNTITLVCKQKDKDDKPCNHKFTVTTKELMDKRGTNNKEIMPDSML